MSVPVAPKPTRLGGVKSSTGDWRPEVVASTSSSSTPVRAAPRFTAKAKSMAPSFRRGVNGDVLESRPTSAAVSVKLVKGASSGTSRYSEINGGLSSTAGSRPKM